MALLLGYLRRFCFVLSSNWSFMTCIFEHLFLAFFTCSIKPHLFLENPFSVVIHFMCTVAKRIPFSFYNRYIDVQYLNNFCYGSHTSYKQGCSSYKSINFSISSSSKQYFLTFLSSAMILVFDKIKHRIKHRTKTKHSKRIWNAFESPNVGAKCWELA